MRDDSATVLEAAGYTPLVDYCVESADGDMSLKWFYADPQPTDQQIDDWASDVAPLPSGQLFSEWQAEHGGDPVKTKRRKALDRMLADDALRVLVRAVAVIVQKEIRGLKKGGLYQRPESTIAELEAELIADIRAGLADDPEPT